MRQGLRTALLLLVLGNLANAQWDPDNGLWGKQDPNQIRVMTWNVFDNLRSAESKVEGINAWTSLATIVASLKPDVLVLQETADNGCFNCVDTVSELETVLELFMHGGTDPFLGGAVGAYVQKYAPGYDLPFIFVSEDEDGFNRNALMSRFPFADLNGDTKSQYSDLPVSFADAYAPGTLGNSIIRGLQFAELDLPDGLYAGDLVVMNAHFKAGGSSSDQAQRLAAGQNAAYLIDYWYNGAGTGIPDPNDKIIESPAATQILGSDTAVVFGGDWNEDELTNGRKGPAEWIVNAQLTGGTDGTDRDRSDSDYGDPRNACNASDRSTIGSTNKLDYVAWQDSIATRELEFVFNSASIGGGCSNGFPAELLNHPAPAAASSFASDHRPVILDVSLPCVGASVAFRNQSPNVTSYTSSTAPIGGTWSVTVDLTTTGHTLAQVTLQGAPATTPLPQGDFLLIGGPKFFKTPLLSGPTAMFSSPIPNDTAFCGIQAYSQAVHLGGVTPYRLSNAQDLTVGF